MHNLMQDAEVPLKSGGVARPAASSNRCLSDKEYMGEAENQTMRTDPPPTPDQPAVDDWIEAAQAHASVDE